MNREAGPPAPGPPRRRWLRRLLLLFLPLAAIVAAIVSGRPQERLLEWIASRILDAEVQLRGLSLWQGRIEEATITAMAGPVRAIAAKDIAWTWRPRGRAALRLHALRIGETRITVNLRAAQDQGRAAWTRQASGGEAAASRPWETHIPRSIVLDTIHVLEVREKETFLLLPLSLRCDFAALDDFSLTAHTPQGALPPPDVPQPAARPAAFLGDFHLVLESRRGAYAADINAHLPDIATFSGKLVYGNPGPQDFQVDMDSLKILDPRLPEFIAASLGLPLRFTQAHSEGLHARGTLNDHLPQFTTLRGDVVFDKLSLGPPDRPWLEHTIALRTEMNPDQNERIRFSIEAATLPPVSGEIVLAEDGGQAEAASDAWTPAYLQHLSPAFGDYSVRLPGLRAATPKLNVRATKSELSMTLELLPQCAPGAKTLEAPLRLHAARSEEGTYDVAINWAADKSGTLSVQGTLARGLLQDLRWKLDQAQLAPWYALLYDAPIPGGWDATASLAGDLALAANLPASFTAEGPIRILPAIKGEAIPGSFSLRAENLLAEEAGPIAFSLDLGEAGRLEARDGRVRLSGDGAYRLPLQWHGELDTCAAIIGIAGLSGEGEITTTLVDSGGEYQFQDLRVSLDTPGYAGYRLPYGAQLRGRAGLSRRKSDGLVTLRKAEFNVDDASRLAFERVAYEPAKAALAAAKLDLSLDLALAARKGWLAAAHNATLTLRSDSLAHGPAGLSGNATAQLRAESLVLPGTVANLAGVSAEIHVAADKGTLSGTGQIGIDRLSAAGVTLPRLATPLRLDGTTLRLESLSSTLFAGAFSGDAAIALENGTPTLALDAYVQDLDLAVFTEEFKPPRVQLAGKASGTVECTLSQAGLHALDVDLRAPAGVAVNRAVVEELVRAQGLAGMQEQVADKVLRRFLGDAPMRPFDSGELRLGMAEDRLTGFARLVSKDLKLSADIKADPGAILEAFQTRAQ